MKDQPIKVELVDDRLVISVGINILAKATELCPNLEDMNDAGDFLGPVVVDKKLWAHEVVQGLKSEQEDGTTPVHIMLDTVFEQLAEDGAEGIRMPSDPSR